MGAKTSSAEEQKYQPNTPKYRTFTRRFEAFPLILSNAPNVGKPLSDMCIAP
ncbi:hypothetical protein BKP43_15080 [Variovorax boronicumulans]|uniref:hypothetical protein n=1 Tax=Variovorax boronicumulans TaxID=436515 RepID=UPI0015525678|nr:hypothetical protein [Variovorax boronicumulans]PBI92764.1 hypothetical protein BKP43_15080 [Variovorax boronicumulans]